MSRELHRDIIHFIRTEADATRAPQPLRPHDTYPATPPPEKVRIVAVSDTHSHPAWTVGVPFGDIFIHCGDLTRAGSHDQILRVYEEIRALPHKHKIVIAGNHDLGLDAAFVDTHAENLLRYETGITREVTASLRQMWKSNEAKAAGIHYLEHEYVTLEVHNQPIHFFGSPYTPEFCDWAFAYDPLDNVWSAAAEVPGAQRAVMTRKRKKEKIVWITHGPAKQYLDSVPGFGSVGCPLLTKEIGQVRPHLHLFGHIHEGAAQGQLERLHGLIDPFDRGSETTLCVNAALLDEKYRLAYEPSVIDL